MNHVFNTFLDLNAGNDLICGVEGASHMRIIPAFDPLNACSVSEVLDRLFFDQVTIVVPLSEGSSTYVKRDRKDS